MCVNKKQVPFMMIFVAFYMIVISMVPHKESRFMIPVMPYIFIVLAQFFTFVSQKRRIVTIIVATCIGVYSLHQIAL